MDDEVKIIDKEFRAAFKKKRKAMNLTIRKFAAKAGCEPGLVTTFENRGTNIGIVNLIILLQGLDINLLDILKEKDQ